MVSTELQPKEIRGELLKNNWLSDKDPEAIIDGLIIGIIESTVNSVILECRLFDGGSKERIKNNSDISRSFLRNGENVLGKVFRINMFLSRFSHDGIHLDLHYEGDHPDEFSARYDNLRKDCESILCEIKNDNLRSRK